MLVVTFLHSSSGAILHVSSGTWQICFHLLNWTRVFVLMSLISFNSRETSTLAPQWQFQLFCRDIPRRPLQHDSDPQRRSFSSPENQESCVGSVLCSLMDQYFNMCSLSTLHHHYFPPGHSWWLVERVLHPGAPEVQSVNRWHNVPWISQICEYTCRHLNWGSG